MASDTKLSARQQLSALLLKKETGLSLWHGVVSALIAQSELKKQLLKALAEERKMADLYGYYEGAYNTGEDLIAAKAETDRLISLL